MVPLGAKGKSTIDRPESSAADSPVPQTGMTLTFGPSAESPSAQPSVQPTPQAASTAGGSPTRQ